MVGVFVCVCLNFGCHWLIAMPRGGKQDCGHTTHFAVMNLYTEIVLSDLLLIEHICVTGRESQLNRFRISRRRIRRVVGGGQMHEGGRAVYVIGRMNSMVIA